MRARARYIRVSTASQSHERQLKKEHPNDRFFIDVCSGSIPFNKRGQGRMLIKAIEAGEVSYLSVHAVDRLGRNLLDILTTLQLFDSKEVIVKVDNLGIESRVKNKPNPAFKLIISVLANISEMERETMLERQKEGIALAKAKGVYRGREKGSVEDKDEFLSKYPQVISLLKQKKSLRDTASRANVSLNTVQKVKKYMNK